MQKKIILKSNNKTQKTNKKLKNDFESVLVPFEKNHSKIINKSIFVKSTNDEHIVMSKTKLITAYEHKNYTVKVKDEEKQKCFIQKWIKYENIKTFDDIGIYPNPKLCPINHLNLWKKFEMSKIKDWQHKEEQLQKILNHIKILCNHQDNVYDYFLKFLGQMLAYPEIKPGVAIKFISDEGIGKGLIIQMLRKMMGRNKVYESTAPSRDCWGAYNAIMANSFLINLNEMSKKEALGADGQIKALITDSSLTINNKGVDAFEVESYHRFIIFSNKDDPINSKKDDRRNLIIRASDEKIGNTEYFDSLLGILDNTDALKTFYEYLIKLPDLENFRKIKKPMTDYQEEIQDNSIDVIEKFIIDLIEENKELDILKISNKSLFDNFLLFLSDKNIKYEINKFQFDLKISRISKKLEIESKRSSTGIIKIFDIKKLLTHYMIDICLPDIKETKNIIEYNCI